MQLQLQLQTAHGHINISSPLRMDPRDPFLRVLFPSGFVAPFCYHPHTDSINAVHYRCYRATNVRGDHARLYLEPLFARLFA